MSNVWRMSRKDLEKENERLREDIIMAIMMLSYPEDIETTKKVQQALQWTLKGGIK